jgi:hypothetical protein
VGAREGVEVASGFGPADFAGARLASVLREFEAGLGAALAIAGMKFDRQSLIVNRCSAQG